MFLWRVNIHLDHGPIESYLVRSITPKGAESKVKKHTRIISDRHVYEVYRINAPIISLLDINSANTKRHHE